MMSWGSHAFHHFGFDIGSLFLSIGYFYWFYKLFTTDIVFVQDFRNVSNHIRKWNIHFMLGFECVRDNLSLASEQV